MYKWKLNILSNDAKRMYSDLEEDFIPYPGLALRGFIGDHEVKVNAVVYEKHNRIFKVALAWMSAEPADSQQMMQMGWQKLIIQQPQYMQQ